MSYNIDFIKNKAIITFSETAEENEITHAFLEVVDTIDIKKLNCILFDCTKVINYAIPADYMSRVKVVTKFSTAWNSDVHIIFIATNSEIRYMAEGFINHSEDLKWKYYLFDNLADVQKLCDELYG